MCVCVCVCVCVCLRAQYVCVRLTPRIGVTLRKDGHTCYTRRNAFAYGRRLRRESDRATRWRAQREAQRAHILMYPYVCVCVCVCACVRACVCLGE